MNLRTFGLLTTLAIITFAGCGGEPEADPALRTVYRLDLWTSDVSVAGLMGGRMATIKLDPGANTTSQASELALESFGLGRTATFRGSENPSRQIELAVYDRAGEITSRNIRLTEAHCRALVGAVTVTVDGAAEINPQRAAFYRGITSSGSCLLERRF